MTILYWDCFSGIAGNMAVASLLDLGASQKKLRDGLSSIAFAEGPVELIIEEKMVDGIRGVYFNTRDDDQQQGHGHHNDHDHGHDHTHDHDHSHCHDNSHNHNHAHADNDNAHDHAPHRGLNDIVALIDKAEITSRAREIAINLFKALAEAEAAIHGKSVDAVHFHEVGARDSIADIVGVAICLDDLQVHKVVVSPVHLGSGMVKCAHGTMPVPAPATALLLKGLPVVFDHHISFELTTPTGAAILKGVGAAAQSLPMTFDRVGHGHGSKNIGQANFLRAFLSEHEQVKKNSETIVLFASNIDNASGEILGHATEELMRLGALDVCLIPVIMKKGRPGHIIQVQSIVERAEAIEKAIFSLLPTLGVRRQEVGRTSLTREAVNVETNLGRLAGKKVCEFDGTYSEKIEFDEIVRLADERQTTPQKLMNKLQPQKKKN